MQLSFLIAKCLMDGDFASYFASVPLAADDPEPIVLRQGKFERGERMADEERGTCAVEVLVVREVCADAEAVAGACERWVREYGWERHAEAWPWRIAGVDTGAPYLLERDSSGRYVWRFDVEVTVVRSL